MRRLRARPLGVALEATGRVSAWPAATSLPGGTPAFSPRKRTTFTARATDSSQFVGKVAASRCEGGASSVWPDTRMERPSTLASTAPSRASTSAPALRQARLAGVEEDLVHQVHLDAALGLRQADLPVGDLRLQLLLDVLVGGLEARQLGVLLLHRLLKLIPLGGQPRALVLEGRELLVVRRELLPSCPPAPCAPAPSVTTSARASAAAFSASSARARCADQAPKPR